MGALLVLAIAAIAIGVFLALFSRNYSLEHMVADLSLQNCAISTTDSDSNDVTVKKAEDCVYHSDKIDSEYFKSSVSIQLVEGPGKLEYAQDRYNCKIRSYPNIGSFRYGNDVHTLSIDLSIEIIEEFDASSLDDVASSVYPPVLRDYGSKEEYQQALEKYKAAEQRRLKAKNLKDDMYTIENLEQIADDISKVLPDEYSLNPKKGCEGDTYLDRAAEDADQEARQEARTQLMRKVLEKRLGEAAANNQLDFDLASLEVSQGKYQVWFIKDKGYYRFVITNASPSKKVVVCVAAIGNVAQGKFYPEDSSVNLYWVSLDIGEQRQIRETLIDDYETIYGDPDAELLSECQAYE